MTANRRITEGAVFFALYAACIWMANYLIANHGQVCIPNGPCLVTVWPGALTPSGIAIMAPTGALMIGLAFTLRDLLQRRLGASFSAIAVIIGAGLSAFLDPALALASGTAFLVSETLDLMVYTPLQGRNLPAAVVGSNIVGMVVDSFLFITIAFGSIAHVEGQIIAKAWMTLAALPLVYLIRHWDRQRGIASVASSWSLRAAVEVA